MRKYGLWLCLLLLSMLGLAGCSEAGRTQEFDAADAPSGQHRLIALVIEPWFPQGPHEVVLVLETLPAGDRQELLRTELAYDGVPFTRRNIGLRWTSARSAVVCLSATDRPDKGVRISVPETGPALVTLKEGC